MKNKINSNNILYVNIQSVLTIISLVAFIMYLFNEKMWYILQFSLGVTLLYLAFTNYKIYKKKYLTVIYLVFGLLLIICNLLSIIGVV